MDWHRDGISCRRGGMTPKMKIYVKRDTGLAIDAYHVGAAGPGAMALASDWHVSYPR